MTTIAVRNIANLYVHYNDLEMHIERRKFSKCFICLCIWLKKVSLHGTDIKNIAKSQAKSKKQKATSQQQNN